MIHIKKTLYILNDNTYINCDHDAFVVSVHGEEKQKVPVSIVQQILIFGNTTVSAYFIQYCSEHGILVSYISPTGEYYGGLRGKAVGNVLLRQKQYRLYDSPGKVDLARNIVLGKGLNQRGLLLRYADRYAGEAYVLKDAADSISGQLQALRMAESVDSIRGIEGKISACYFKVFDRMILSDETEMQFVERSRRPPLNYCNALLSYLYTMTTVSCVSALECFGLDSYMGYLHELHPGRESLACDLVEEFRAPLVDQFVLNIINKKQIQPKDFEREKESIRLSKDGRTKLFQLWEAYKTEKVYFSLYDKEVPKGLLPYLQAQLLSQYIRGDLQEYPPYVEDR
jgi:CRISPR-associated protein Cas1